jgi:hypothetical protein
MSMVYLHTRFHMLKSNDLLANAIRPEAKCRFLSHILQHVYFNMAGHGSRAVWGMNCLRPDAVIVDLNSILGMYV